MDHKWCLANPTKAAAEIARLRKYFTQIEVGVSSVMDEDLGCEVEVSMDIEQAQAIARVALEGRPDLCCMWCGGERPEIGWHYLGYPQALCSEKCQTAFSAAL